MMAAANPSRCRLLTMRSVPRLVRANTRQRPVSLASNCCRTSCLRSAETSKAWNRTFSQGFSVDPKASRTGFFIESFTSCATDASSVAENHMVWRDLGVLAESANNEGGRRKLPAAQPVVLLRNLHGEFARRHKD